MAIKITIAEITLKNIATFEVQDQYCTQKALDAERAAHSNTARDLELRLAEQELQANILEQHREVIRYLESKIEALETRVGLMKDVITTGEALNKQANVVIEAQDRHITKLEELIAALDAREALRTA